MGGAATAPGCDIIGPIMTALAKTDFSREYEAPKVTDRPLGEQPIVAARLRVSTNASNMKVLHIAPLTGKEISIALTDELTGLSSAFATMVALHSGVGQVVDVVETDRSQGTSPVLGGAKPWVADGRGLG